MFTLLKLLPFILPALADVVTGIPDSAPPGFEQWTSEIVLPAKDVVGDGDWGSAVARARTFVAQLTLEEKVNVTTGADIFGRCVGNTGSIPRLNWAGLCLQDSPLGVRAADFASAFPTAINAAATWDKKLILARGKAMGEEHRGKGVNVALSPMANMGRVAAGGRNWEGFGADPYLTGACTAQTVIGLQSTGVMANVKHLIGNEQEHFRGGSSAPHVYSSNIDDKTAHELYLWPFAEAINSGVASVMCSYNKVNQTQTCQSSKLLNGIVKEELDFQGFVVSDWAAMINGVQPALAGMDMNMPGFIGYGIGDQDEQNPAAAVNSYWGAALIDAVKNGSVPESRVDDMVTRTFAAWYKLGQDSDYPAVNFDSTTQDTYNANGGVTNEHVNVQGDHYKLIREIGAASTVLLKNTNGALPLSLDKIKRLAIVGSDAGPNPDGPNSCLASGCQQGTLAMGWGSGTANFPYLIDPYSAIQSFVHAEKPNVVVEAVFSDFNYAQVGNTAGHADTCLVFVNAASGEGYLTVDGNQGDRNNLTLWHEGNALINATASVCSNTIVTMHAVGPVLVESWIDHPNVTAVLSAGLPGQETGNAIVDILFGAVNPSGRLPYTMAKERTDYPADVLYELGAEDTPQITYSEGLEIDYRHFDAKKIEPRFEFGFGLSYTSFEYSVLSVLPSLNRRSDHSHWHRRITGHSGWSRRSTSPATNTSLPSTSASSSAAAEPSSAAASSTVSGPTSFVSSSSSSAPSSIISGSGITSSMPSSVTSSASAPSSSNATATSSAPTVVHSPIETNPGGPASLYETIYTVSFAVTNTGKVDGNEVSQLYLTFPEGAGQPPRVLRGFERTFVSQGMTEQVQLPLRRKDVSIWDVVQQKWVIPEGSFKIAVGSSSRNILLEGDLTPQP